MSFVDTINRQKSAVLFEEAKKYFPGGVNSPVRAFKSVSGPPLFIKKGDKCKIVDEDNNEYIDFCCSWGPLILGHNNEKVRDFVIETIGKGTSFGTPNLLGNELGKIMIEHNRFIEKIRFVSSGTEAVMSAIRLARGYTGKDKVIKFEGCYHGHVDSLLVKAGSGLATFGVSTSAGIPASFAKETIVLPLNDLNILEDTLKQYHNELACVIIEPIPANNGLLLQDREYLVQMSALCTKYDVLLIFDEVISGFRVGFEGAAGYYDIKPDLVTYGKIIGGGMPVGAYGGRADIMGHIAPDGAVYQAGTLSANPVAMAAGLATLKQLLEPRFYTEMSSKTKVFTSTIETYCREKGYTLHIPTVGSIFWLAFTQKKIQSADEIDASSMEYFKILHHELLQRGIYLGPSGYEVGFVSAAHTSKDLEVASNIIKECLDLVFD